MLGTGQRSSIRPKNTCWMPLHRHWESSHQWNHANISGKGLPRLHSMLLTIIGLQYWSDHLKDSGFSAIVQIMLTSQDSDFNSDYWISTLIENNYLSSTYTILCLQNLSSYLHHTLKDFLGTGKTLLFKADILSDSTYVLGSSSLLTR